MQVYAPTGRLVADIADLPQDPGFHSVRWDGRDSADRRLPAGVYFIHMRTTSNVWNRKVLLMR